MKNIKLLIEYDGTNYSGWQRQTNALSVQQVLEEALFKLTGENVTVIGSGRTDSGVHARGQVANFFTASAIPPDRFSYALNTLIPSDIRVLDSGEVPGDFHARYSAVAKRYKYSIFMRAQAPAIGRNYYYHIPDRLDVDAMKAAVRYIIGTHDFKAFQSSGGSQKSTVRTVYEASWELQSPDCLYFNIKGNGFLYNMVRILVGTFIEIGRHKMTPSGMKYILESGERANAGPTAPPHGLCLEEVYY
ncbi:MAG: tRNA pseudouridine(38-40) synthase TruA [Clostridiales bacterium]|nr:tRNA pseudouridine(38-40) synthase TruA [Clostridiales bacterium]